MFIGKNAALIRNRWSGDGGYRQLLTLAVPLIFGSTFMAIQQFVDRVFLAWYSPEAVAATLPAGILNFTILNLFIGTAGYTGTFVAQYYGAGEHHKIGPIVWQGFYIAAIAFISNFFLIPLAGPFFKMVGHAPDIQQLETIYFRISCMGAGPVVVIAIMSGFFTGRGKVRAVTLLGVFTNTINMILNYLLIFGKLGFPELGVKGAAIATLTATLISFAVFIMLFFSKENERQFQVLTSWRFNLPLFMRLLKFGLPSGVQFFVMYISISVFILLVGRIGTIELASTNIAFNINMLAFMPMTGFSAAIMILVGQYQGKREPWISERSVYSGLHLTFTYMFCLSAAYMFIPEVFLWPFEVNSDAARFGEIKQISIILLRFIALYSLFDSLNIVFVSGIKGAGDTKFPLILIGTLSIVLLAIPTYFVLDVFHLGLYAAWIVLTIYIIVLSFSFLLRFLGGKWKTMRVIEDSVPSSC